jgi:hypothetical protein
MSECTCDQHPPIFTVPTEETLTGSDAHPAGNQLYLDLRARFDPASVKTMVETDQGLVRRLREWNEPHGVRRTTLWYLAERAGMTMEQYESSLFDDSPYSYLDPGVASTVLALAVYGAVPTTSCNGGVFGDEHYHPLPLVAFYASPAHGKGIVKVAKRVGMHIEQSVALNCPMIWHAEIDPFLEFARLLNAQVSP